MSKTLYVGNLPYSMSEADLVDLFASFGGTNARVIQGRGFGFIDVDDEQMEAAIEAKHGKDAGGRVLTVNEARPKTAGGGGGGGYGGGGGGRSGGGGYGGGGGGGRSGGGGGDRNDRGGGRRR